MFNLIWNDNDYPIQFKKFSNIIFMTLFPYLALESWPNIHIKSKICIFILLHIFLMIRSMFEYNVVLSHSVYLNESLLLIQYYLKSFAISVDKKNSLFKRILHLNNIVFFSFKKKFASWYNALLNELVRWKYHFTVFHQLLRRKKIFYFYDYRWLKCFTFSL